MKFSVVKKMNPWDIAAGILFTVFLLMMVISPVKAGFTPDGYYYPSFSTWYQTAEDCDQGACPVVYLPFGTNVSWTPQQAPFAAECFPYDYTGGEVSWSTNYPPYYTTFSSCQASYPNGFYAIGVVPAIASANRLWWVGATKPDFAVWGAGSLSSSFNADPDTGTSNPPVEVFFEDTSQGGPTSFNWSINGVPNGTTRNLSYTFTSAGTYEVKHGVSTSTENDIATINYEVLSWAAPECSFSASAYTGNSPLEVQFNDTSSNNPTNYVWNLNSDYAPWFTVTPDEYNTTANPKITIVGTGDLRIAHQVSNPAGSSVCSPLVITVSGVAPTPTPTPNIPFPNQTGICENSQISLGSTWFRNYEGYYTLQIPNGGVLDGFYLSGAQRLISGQYTLELGQYFYNEYNSSGQLEYRSSYVVQNCAPYPTGTPTVLPTLTPVQTFPTVTGTHAPDQPYTSVPTISPFQPLPTQLIASNTTNITYIRDKLTTWSGMTVPYMDFIDSIMGALNNVFLNILQYAVNPLLFATNGGYWIIGVYTSSVAGFSGIIALISYAMTSFINSLGYEVQSGIVVIMSLDTMIQLIELKRGGVI